MSGSSVTRPCSDLVNCGATAAENIHAVSFNIYCMKYISKIFSGIIGMFS